MAEKKVKIIDIHEQYKKLNKVSKKICAFGTVIGIMSSLVVLAVGVVSALFPQVIFTSNVRSYSVKFLSYKRKEISSAVYKRGETLVMPEYDMSVPDDEDGTTYTFIGWDTTGDFVPDIIPSRVYYTFTARPVYFAFNPYGTLNDDDTEQPTENTETEVQDESK